MISLAHRTVFVHVPKCGGQSVELAFLQALGLDWKTRKLLLLMAKPKGWGGMHSRLAHLKAREYLRFNYLPQALWSDFFSFAVVRNPFARVASAYHYLDSHPNRWRLMRCRLRDHGGMASWTRHRITSATLTARSLFQHGIGLRK